VAKGDHCKPETLRLEWRASPEQAVSHYLEANDRLLRNADYARPPGLTIEQCLQRLAALKIDAEQGPLADLFSRMHYAGDKISPDPDGYRRLFELLYEIGPPGLKLRLSSRPNALNPLRGFSGETD
jgi:hypothetical protein